MVGAAVGTEVMRVRLIRLAARDDIALRVAPVLRVPLEELEVHHVVDDDDEARTEVVLLWRPRPVVPAADQAEIVVVPRPKRRRRVVQERGIARVAREAQAVARRAVRAEADVVVVRVVAERLDQLLRPVRSRRLPRLLARQLVKVPERTGDEAAAPVLRRDHLVLPLLPGPRNLVRRLVLHRLQQRAVMVFAPGDERIARRSAQAGQGDKQHGKRKELFHHCLILHSKARKGNCKISHI